jgi:outer membrane protein TolC
MINYCVQRRRTLGLGFLVCIAGGALLEAGLAGAEAPAATQLAALRQQRIDTLQTASGVAREMYQNGTVLLQDVLRVDRLLLDARLEIASTDKDRAKVLADALKVAKQQEALTSQHHQAGAVTSLTVLEATADRLRVEAQLAELATR